MDLDPVLWPLRSGDAGVTFPRVELELLAVAMSPFFGIPKSPLGLEVVAEGIDLLVGAAGHREVAERFVGRTGKEAHRRAVLGRHVGNRGAVGERERGPLLRRSTRTNLPTTFDLRSISVMVSTTSVAVTPSLTEPLRWTPTTSGVRK